MFKVTADLFSGRPNPAWIVNDKKGEQLLQSISKERQIVSKPSGGFEGLGFRGLIIEILNDEGFEKLPATFSIANGLAKDQKTSLEFARKIVDQMPAYAGTKMDTHELTPINRDIQKIIFGSIDQYEKDINKIKKILKSPAAPPPPTTTRVTVPDKECGKCEYEESKFNPGFWNSDSFVLRNNNCYNYGRNWRTNTFAQPGRFSGTEATFMTCADVSAAAIRDGLRQRCDCLPVSEYPRRLMALVIAPGKDYHWYRKQKDGFWGHKPGGTPAKNIDNSGMIITDPRTCDRGSGTYLNYTDFCGFFYAGKSVNIR